MKSSSLLFSTGVLAFLVFSPAVAARTGRTPPIHIEPARGTIRVDGRLDDPGWKGATEVSTFYETNPGDNVKPPVRTTAWVTYDREYFYVAFRCEDPDPSKIRAPYVDRDNVFSDQDFVGIMLDTRNDGRSAWELFVNPRGIHDDGVMTDSTGYEDFSPDIFWDSAGRITATGWDVEMRIPFSSLRYSTADPQTWGILFYRNYPRDFRYQLFSAPLPRGRNSLLAQEDELTGLSGLPSAGHLVVAPYVTGREVGKGRRGPGTPFVNHPPVFDGGVDVKWTPGADNAVDFTLNPDFSQVESDVAQISANQRFALFYQEKRPFFMEGVDLFQMPINAVYTRTITSPSWGIRATGHLAGVDYTVLSAQDRGGGSVIIPGPQASEFAPQDFASTASIFRVRKSFGLSFAGFLATDRENRGGGYNRVFGPDFQWNASEHDKVTGQFLFSQTITPDRPDLSSQWDGGALSGGDLSLSWEHDGRHWTGYTIYEDVAGGFRADDGFVPQVGYRSARGNIGYTFYTDGFFNRVHPEVIAKQYWRRHSGSLAGSFWPGIYVNGKGSLYFGTWYNYDTQRVGDRLLHASSVYFEGSASPSLVLSRVSFSGQIGERFDYANAAVGHGGDLSLNLTARATDHLSLDFNGEHQWLDSVLRRLSGRLFTADVARVKAVYTFSARSFLRAIAQWVSTRRNTDLYPYDAPSRDGGLQSSILYAYRLNWQTVFYAGYGDTRTLSPRNRLLRSDRQVFFKVSYAFQR